MKQFLLLIIADHLTALISPGSERVPPRIIKRSPKSRTVDCTLRISSSSHGEGLAPLLDSEDTRTPSSLGKAPFLET